MSVCMKMIASLVGLKLEQGLQLRRLLWIGMLNKLELMMSNIYFTSDWHVQHKNIHKLRKEVESEQHNEYLIKRSCRALTKRDTLFLLGDICFTEDALQLIDDLPKCRKILVKGNHDLEGTRRLLDVFDEVEGFVRYKKFWLSHCPVHPDELRGRSNIHGHTHYVTLEDNRYLNVCPERSMVKYGSYLVTYDQVKEYFSLGGVGYTEPKPQPVSPLGEHPWFRVGDKDSV